MFEIPEMGDDGGPVVCHRIPIGEVLSSGYPVSETLLPYAKAPREAWLARLQLDTDASQSRRSSTPGWHSDKRPVSGIRAR